MCFFVQTKSTPLPFTPASNSRIMCARSLYSGIFPRFERPGKSEDWVAAAAPTANEPLRNDIMQMIYLKCDMMLLLLLLLIPTTMTNNKISSSVLDPLAWAEELFPGRKRCIFVKSYVFQKCRIDLSVNTHTHTHIRSIACEIWYFPIFHLRVLESWTQCNAVQCLPKRGNSFSIGKTFSQDW